MQYDVKKIADRLKAERKKHGISQDDLAAELKVNRGTLSSWETAWRPTDPVPPLKHLLKLCDKYKCELGYLLCEHDCKTRKATDIQDAIGLSEKSIEVLQSHCVNIRECEKDSDFTINARKAARDRNALIINAMFESDGFSWWLNAVRSCAVVKKNLSDEQIYSDYIDVQNMSFFDGDGEDISDQVKQFLFSPSDILTALNNECNHKYAVLNEQIIKEVTENGDSD